MQDKPRQFRKLNAAFSLIELSLVFCVMSVIASAAIPAFIKSIYSDAARKCALEINQIQEAARAYYINNRTWPELISNLQMDGFIDSAWIARNQFGHDYFLSRTGTVLSVNTKVPVSVVDVTARLLPMTSVSGEDLRSDITVPGVDIYALPVGAIVPWPGADIPSGWYVCDGRPLLRTDHQVLFQVLGTIYGAGDGLTTFNLPDLRGRAVVGLDNMGGVPANIIQGEWSRGLGMTGGEDSHVLSIGEMPPHSHGYGFATVGGRYDGHSSPLFNATEWRETASTGGGLPHNNIQPSMALNWIIKG